MDLRNTPRFEVLEKRLLLGANVTGFVSLGNLYLYGNFQDSNIQITNPAANQFTVTPGLGTLVNGGAAPVPFGGVTGDIMGYLYGGDDVVTVDNVVIPGTFSLPRTINLTGRNINE